jgi:iron complex outermembrane recepter protein
MLFGSGGALLSQCCNFWRSLGNLNNGIERILGMNSGDVCSAFRRYETVFLTGLFFLAFGTSVAFAQNGAVSGLVTDPSGAPIANAQITLRNNARQVEFHSTTNEMGSYSLAGVPEGGYTFVIEAGGFARYEKVSVVVDGKPLTLDAKLKLLSSAQSVVVRADEGPSLEQTPNLDKMGTKLEDLPRSVQIIDRETVDSQGGIALKDTIRNASGVFQGGSDSFGFNDRFLIRGLDARIYNDGFSDGDQRNGIPHSLNGVERVEVLEGPGSALYGSGPPGGTINVVHFAPSEVWNYGGSFEVGSFGLVSGSGYVTGPTHMQGLNFRVDGLAQHDNGFRSLASGDYELRPEISYTVGKHFILLAVDGRYLQATPDPAGLIYVNGTPITGVSREAKYSTPFSLGDQTLARATFSDMWNAGDNFTVTNRFSYMYRNLSILRNGDGGTVTGIVFSGRQLRQQHDTLNDFDYELEPVWRFRTGGLRHTLLTGFEAQHQGLFANRATADLPNITNIFDPIIPEQSVGQLTFLRDAKHSGFIDDLAANYFGLYAVDQVEVTERFKVRVSGRQDWWNTTLDPQIFVPGRIFQGDELIEPPNTYRRSDTPFSWSAGGLYRVFPNVSAFFGVARSNLATFSSEATQNGIHEPESGLQYEAGIKASAFSNRAIFTLTGFDVTRNNVFTLVGDTPVFNDQKTDGFEANTQVALMANWRVLANFTVQHAFLTDNPSNPAATGKDPVGVPQHIFNLWTTYDFRVKKLSGLMVGGGLSYRDSMFGDILNTKSIPSYVTLDTVFGYSSRKWSVSAGIRNLTDRLYFVAANGGGGFVGDPRTFFVQTRWNFGSIVK